MKQIPMMLQLIIILLLVMIIPTSILTSYSGSLMLKYSEEMIAETSLAGLNANRTVFEQALNKLESDAALLSSYNHIFNQIRYLETYDDVNASFTNYSHARVLYEELQSLNRGVDGVYSSFFHLEGSDYVISTDEGITMLDRYEPIDWLTEALADKSGISGVWIPRKLSNGMQVLSYVLPLNSLTNTTRGTIVVNLKESQIREYLHSSDPAEAAYLLLDAKGQIVSHKDSNLFHTSEQDRSLVQEIMMQPTHQGYAYEVIDGERMLITWSRSDRGEWLTMKLHSMDELLSKAKSIERNILFIMVLLIVAAVILTVLLARWLSHPVRRLVQVVRSHPKLSALYKKNELAFLDIAFKRMQEEETALQMLLEQRERDTRSLAVQRLLQGEVTDTIADIFPERFFRVAVLSIDRYDQYVSKHNRETRSYNRYLFFQLCERSLPDSIHHQISYQGDGYFAFVMNGADLDEPKVLRSIETAFAKIRDGANTLFGQSVSISVSDHAELVSLVPDLLAEAMELIKQRMIKGSGSITVWSGETETSHKFIYPGTSERRILNYLDTGDLDSIFSELEAIRQEIRSAEYISYDNILFIYNQLAGATIRHLRENGNSARVLAGRSNIYSRLAAFDTIEEIEDYLRDFYAEVVKDMSSQSMKTIHGERIIQYLEEHYHEDIIFEDMAAEIGISYSYMRKIVSELTGKSLIDYLNLLRIEKAKELLLNTEHTVAQIAEQIGYNNVQSFNRYFRKYEGMSPSQYRTKQLSASS